MKAIDKLLACKPDLRRRFERMAADIGVSGDMLMREMQRHGLPAKRSAVYAWMKGYRVADRHRPNTLRSRIIAAILKLGRKRLYKLADELGTRNEVP